MSQSQSQGLCVSMCIWGWEIITKNIFCSIEINVLQAHMLYVYTIPWPSPEGHYSSTTASFKSFQTACLPSTLTLIFYVFLSESTFLPQPFILAYKEIETQEWEDLGGGFIFPKIWLVPADKHRSRQHPWWVPPLYQKAKQALPKDHRAAWSWCCLHTTVHHPPAWSSFLKEIRRYSFKGKLHSPYHFWVSTLECDPEFLFFYLILLSSPLIFLSYNLETLT